MSEILTMDCTDRTGEHTYLVQLLYEFGNATEALTEEKMAQIWINAKQHPVLFGDDTVFSLKEFVALFLNPAGVWMDVTDETGKQVGVFYITSVIPGFDATGHFAFWDSVASGRQHLVHRIMEWAFDRYKLHRLSAETPPYQTGTIRFLNKLGFVHEGERREAIRHGGEWKSLVMFSILDHELAALIHKET
jgi:RimJ/RimL family protein N-acetyltransferase